MDLTDVEPPWFSKLENLWGLISQVLVLKVGMSDVEFKPFTPQRDAPRFELPPVEGCSAEDGVYSVMVSQPPLPASMWALLCQVHFVRSAPTGARPRDVVRV